MSLYLVVCDSRYVCLTPSVFPDKSGIPSPWSLLHFSYFPPAHHFLSGNMLPRLQYATANEGAPKLSMHSYCLFLVSFLLLFFFKCFPPHISIKSVQENTRKYSAPCEPGSINTRGTEPGGWSKFPSTAQTTYLSSNWRAYFYGWESISFSMATPWVLYYLTSVWRWKVPHKY